jgi:protein TonB
MLAYAPTRRRVAERPSSPNAMLFVISAHVVAIAAVMSAKMDLPRRIFDPPPKVISIPMPKDPPPIEIARSLPPQPLPQPVQSSRPENPQPNPLVTSSGPAAGPNADPGPIEVAGANVVVPELPPKPSASAAQLLTSGAELKPPYPQSKLLSEEEALLQLRLTIDEHGRVVAVDPVGGADPVFLAAARRYLLAHWRYKPAMSDGRPVSTALTILLRFQLDD